MDEKIQVIIDAIRSMKANDKPNVDDIKPIAGFRPTADERDQAWQYIQDNPVDEDIPHATPNPVPTDEAKQVAKETAGKPSDDDAAGDVDSGASTGTSEDKPKSKPNPDEETAEILWVRTVTGHPARHRAGHSFDRTWKQVDGQALSAQQEEFLRNDKYLQVRDNAPEVAKSAE